MPFDPNKPFEAVSTPSRTFDPSQPFEAATKPQESPKPPETNWTGVFSGLDKVDTFLNADQKAAFKLLDTSSQNLGEDRARALNQSYAQQRMEGINPSLIANNWPSARSAFAKHELGIDKPDITDSELYQGIGKKLQEADLTARAGEIKPWTWVDSMTHIDARSTVSAGKFWDSINKPYVKLPDAPADLPNIPSLGMYNPAVVAGTWNVLKPILEGVESPFGLATLSGAAELKAAAETYPVAAKAMATMSGVFTGMMAYAAYEAGSKVKDVLNDPKSSVQDKIEAIGSAVADSGMALLAGVGTVFELIPKERVPPLLKKIENGHPAQAAEALREEAKAPENAEIADQINAAADQFEKIATETPPAQMELPLEAAAEPEKIMAAAIQAKDGAITEGPEHAAIDAEGKKGFTTTTGRFVGREEAMGIAADAGQLNDAAEGEKLHSHMVEMVAEEGVAKEAPKPASEKLTSIKNEAVDAALAEEGLPPATHGETLTWEKAAAEADAEFKKDPMAGQKLVDALTEAPRALNGTEDAILTREMVRLKNVREALEKQMLAAVNAGNETAIADLRGQIAAARDAFVKAGEASTKAGTKTAQGLALRRMAMKEDYSLAAMERRRQVAQGGKPLAPEAITEIRALGEQLKKAQADFDAYRAAQEAKRRAPSQKTPSRVNEYLSKRANEARTRIAARAKQGRVMAGVDPSDLADHVIIGADILAKGITKFSDWANAMAKEFGDELRPYLRDLYDRSVKERKDAARLSATKTRTQTEIKKGEAKLESGDFTKEERKPLPLDEEALKLKAKLERVKNLVAMGEEKARLAERTPGEKVRDTFLKWVRVSALSYPSVIGKLTGAAAARLVTTPVEQIVGLITSKVLPELAGRARLEAVPSVGTFVRSEAKAITQSMTTGMKGSWDLLRNKETDLSAILEKQKLPPELVEYLGKLHSALKYPTRIADYARRLEIINAKDLAAKVDVTNPTIQLRNMHEAWVASNRAIFMQDNGIVNAFRSATKSLEAKQKATGKPSPALQAISTAIQAELPIVKVPSNVVAEIIDGMTGSVTGPARAALAYMSGRVKTMPAAEADAILRSIKKGSIGAAFLALGYYESKNLGGYYQQGEKRKPTEIQPGEWKVSGMVIPKQLLHNPYAEIAQYGATIGRVSGSLIKKNGGNTKGPLFGLMGATIGLLDEVPFVRETTTIGRYMDERQALSAIDAKVASVLIPGLVQWSAAQMDKPVPFSPFSATRTRKPKGLTQTLEKGIPGLREELPQRDISTSLRN